MLQVFGGLDRLVNALARPAADRAGGASPEAASSAAPMPRMVADSDNTLGVGRSSALTLEPAVTLEGIASTLSRIYSSQVA